MFGFPSYPSRQEQTGLWFWTKQLALVPQSQGLRHILLMQASVLGQSVSAVQPGGTGSKTGLHSPLALGTHPSGQVQVIVLNGTESSTMHLAVDEQGVSSLQGSLHFSERQASPLAQSESTSHSGVFTGLGGAMQYANGSPLDMCSGHLQLAA